VVEPDSERLPCGCYGRCRCRKLGYTGFAVATVLSLLIALGLGMFVGLFSGGILQLREVLLAGTVSGMCMLVVSLLGTVIAIGCAVLSEGRHSARQVWAITKMALGMALGSVAGSGIGVLLLLAQSH
jgi:hypothetical protein